MNEECDVIVKIYMPTTTTYTILLHNQCHVWTKTYVLIVLVHDYKLKGRNNVV